MPGLGKDINLKRLRYKSPAITAHLQHTGWRGLLGLGLAVLLYPKKHTACARSPPLRLCCRIPRIAGLVRAWPTPRSGLALFFPSSLYLTLTTGTGANVWGTEGAPVGLQC